MLGGGGHKDKRQWCYWSMSVYLQLYLNRYGHSVLLSALAQIGVCPYIVAWPDVKVTQSDTE